MTIGYHLETRPICWRRAHICIKSDGQVGKCDKNKKRPENQFETSHGCKHDMTKLLVYAARHDTIKEKKNLGQTDADKMYAYNMYVTMG